MELGSVVVGAGAGITDDLWDVFGLTTFHDFMASNTLTGAMVSLLYERLVFPSTRMTVQEYIEVAAGLLGAMGMDFVEIPGTTRIGNYLWYSYGSVWEVLGMNIYGRNFINIQDGFVRMIQIVYSDMSGSWEEILEMFN